MSQKSAVIRLPKAKISRFRRRMLSWYAHRGNRDFIWRKSPTPYRVLVAEVMLQQTQVARVEPKYRQFLRRYPNVRKLARANTRELLTLWSGLGYNRRALHLREGARKIVRDFGGRIPDDTARLRQLPGIGPYTASAITIFARNRDAVCVDTNIRRVLTHALQLPPTLNRKQLEHVARQVLPRGRSRIWHSALMDYGRLVATSRVTRVRALGKKGEPYPGSRRYFRGKVLQTLISERSQSVIALSRQLGLKPAVLQSIAGQMQREGLVVVRGKRLLLPAD